MSEAHPWSVIQSIAERRIAEAQERGDFDNLPGTGKPLRLEDDSAVPEELRMAYRLLKNAGYLPPELADRKEINTTLDLLEHCHDERERVRHMQRLRFLVERARMRYQRSLHLGEDDPYYDRLLEKLQAMREESPAHRGSGGTS